MASQERSRKFALVTYLPEPVLVECLNKHQSSIRGFAYAYHDKDETEEGKIKETHAHIVLWLYNASTIERIRRWFYALDDIGQPINTLGQVCHDIFSAYEYLWHKNNPEKYQYDPSVVVSSDPSLFESDDSPDDSLMDAVNDLLEGVPLIDVTRRYGRDFIMRYGHIRQLMEDIKNEARTGT